jgi:hypothetical protein
MGCSNCGDKKSARHNVPYVSAATHPSVQTGAGSFTSTRPSIVAEQQVSPGKSFKPDQNLTEESPFVAFLEAQNLSYEEIMARQKERVKFAQEQSEVAIAQMSSNMRRVYVELLVDVANGDLMSMGSMTPDQAIVGLKQLLDRTDFAEVKTLYPNLQPQVLARYEEIVQRRIILDKNI